MCVKYLDVIKLNRQSLVENQVHECKYYLAKKYLDIKYLAGRQLLDKEIGYLI